MIRWLRIRIDMFRALRKRRRARPALQAAARRGAATRIHNQILRDPLMKESANG